MNIEQVGGFHKSHNGLANRRLQPLGHISVAAKCNEINAMSMSAVRAQNTKRAPDILAWRHAKGNSDGRALSRCSGEVRA